MSHFVLGSKPDSIGTGGSSKPSDGLRGNFPRYNYQDTVQAHYQLLTQELGIQKLYLIIGNSMGGMQAWEWATLYPDYMERVIPMAATPIAMSSRNWLMRKMVIDAITEDPAWQNGFYSKQPEKFQKVYTYYSIATNGGDIAWQQMAHDRQTSEAILQERLNKPVTMDANDFLYQWDSSRDFDPTPLLSSVKASVLAINSEDDERNPVLTKKLEEALSHVANADYFIIPASEETRGHATVMDARLWKHKLVEFMANTNL